MNYSGNFFNDFANQFDTFYNGKRSRTMQWIDQRFRRDMFIRFNMTFKLMGNLNSKRIIDIGCGSGPYIAESIRRGAFHVTGIDPAPRMLDLARKRLAQLGVLEKASFVQGYFPQICPQGPYDFAIVMGVMDYIQDVRPFIKEIRNIVSQGAILSFPSTHWFRTPLRKFRYKQRDCAVYFYDDIKINNLMRSIDVSNYELMKISGAGMDYVVRILV